MTTIDESTNRTLPGAAAMLRAGVAPSGPAAPGSSQRFPDGGAWRLEIPSVEGPEPLAAVLAEAARLNVPVHRISQGSGVMMLDDAEIRDMVQQATEADVEVCLFLGPRGTWDYGAATRSSSGGAGPRARGQAQLGQCLADAERAAGLGVRNVLIADEGVLWACHRLRENGGLPTDMRFKYSVLSAPVNPMSLRVLGHLGADSVNVPSDLTIEQVAELRAASTVALDMYLESPDDTGGIVRLYDAAELVRVGAPIYLKFGLRNAPGIYPAGRHLRTVAVDSARERVRRAHLALELWERTVAQPCPPSPRPAAALPVPLRFATPDGEAGA
jgi:hypothetical protein